MLRKSLVRNAFAITALAVLTACGGGNASAPFAPDSAVAAARYVHAGPPMVTLFTVVNNRTGAGAHSGLLINGSERVLFDPAGSFYHPRLPERNDLHYGMSDRMVAFYIDYHARETYRVIEQNVPVSPQVAELVIARAKARGAVAKSFCANSIAGILDEVPGFEGINSTMFPNKLSERFAALPGVTTRTITDDDADDNHGVLLIDPVKVEPTITIAEH
ncbi:hypothetical protein [Tabrizicola oligotrophica]|uniref:Lipoprotein n=1 Tax=Tabrizicola oligotrophica TaxID=2710650 RepID=A0A6M0QWL7_9RHOB|nr:hypothetical protein [Tabrizicola oligotrophica]NEY90892.1 hypothetical protein [Tabrizicola oligotrophica]